MFVSDHKTYEFLTDRGFHIFMDLGLDSLVIPLFSKGWISKSDLVVFSGTHRCAHSALVDLLQYYKQQHLNDRLARNTSDRQHAQ